jgi:hypothetical protein
MQMCNAVLFIPVAFSAALLRQLWCDMIRKPQQLIGPLQQSRAWMSA